MNRCTFKLGQPPASLLPKNGTAFYFILLELPTHRFFLLAEHFGTGKKIFIFRIWYNWFWEFPQVQFEQWSHCVHICVAVGVEYKKSLMWIRVILRDWQATTCHFSIVTPHFTHQQFTHLQILPVIWFLLDFFCPIKNSGYPQANVCQL